MTLPPLNPEEIIDKSAPETQPREIAFGYRRNLIIDHNEGGDRIGNRISSKNTAQNVCVAVPKIAKKQNEYAARCFDCCAQIPSCSGCSNDANCFNALINLSRSIFVFGKWP